MTETWLLAALWLGLALIATLLSIWLRVATALSEIVVGTVAQLIIGATIGTALLHTDDSWIKFLSGTGAIVLTFLAGAELDPAVVRTKWKRRASLAWSDSSRPFSVAPRLRIGDCIGGGVRVGLPVSRCRRPRSRSCTPSCWSSDSM